MQWDRHPGSQRPVLVGELGFKAERATETWDLDELVWRSLAEFQAVDLALVEPHPQFKLRVERLDQLIR